MSEGFLSRWSRLKREREAGVPAKPAAATASEGTPEVPTAQVQTPPEDVQKLVESLPPVESLTPESDFSVFMQPKVPEALKRQALKKLFRDPHFSQMDGLDVYIDDYNTFTPIPEDWYKDLPSWQRILNPTEPLDTGKGYFVEPDSEEGRAILEARAKAARQDAALNEGASVSGAVPQQGGDAAPTTDAGAVSGQTPIPDSAPPAAESAQSHRDQPRQNPSPAIETR